jgi:hypothetical protein
MYRSILADKRVLIVLDNAYDAEQVRPLLPGASGCLVVVTSRNPLIGLVISHGGHPLAVDLFSSGEARAFLTIRLDPRRVAAEPDAVDDLILRAYATEVSQTVDTDDQRRAATTASSTITSIPRTPPTSCYSQVGI